MSEFSMGDLLGIFDYAKKLGQIRTFTGVDNKIPGAAILFGLLFLCRKKLLLLLRYVLGHRKIQKEIKLLFEKLIEFIIGICHGRLTFSHRYSNQIQKDHRNLQIRSFSAEGNSPLEIRKIFILPRIAKKVPSQVPTGLRRTADIEANHDIWEFLHNAQNGDINGRVLVILGPPGCGKTTLLQHVALELSRPGKRITTVLEMLRFKKIHKNKLKGLRSTVPLLFFLKEHLGEETKRIPSNLAECARKQFSDTKIYPNLNPPKDWFKNALEKGRCLVMLDGLDEVINSNQTVQWVDQQVKLYSNCLFVLTSRPRAYEIAPVKHGFTLAAQPFNLEQQKQFLRNWYLACFSQGGNYESGRKRKSKSELLQEAVDETEKLLLRLKRKPELYELTSNPLLLYLIAATHHISGNLPENRLELYREICEQLLGKTKESLSIAQDRSKILEVIASVMMQGENLEGISTEEALPTLIDTMREIGLSPDQQVLQGFLAEASTRSSLFLENDARWRFDHRSFQEYFAACYYNRKGLFAFPKTLSELVDKPFWSETLRLFALMGGSSSVVEVCLANNTVNALRLALEILDEDEKGKIKPELRARLEHSFKSDLESIDSGRRNFAAEIVLAGRLRRHWIPLDESAEIDTRPLTVSEYLLFIEKTNQRSAVPAHWVLPAPSKSSAEKPILGVTGYQAQAFIEWLNCWDSTNTWKYRLPCPDEIAELTTESSRSHAVWVQKDTESHYLDGLSKRKRLEIEKECTKLSKLPLRLHFCLNAVLDLNLFGGAIAEISNIDFACDYARARLSNDKISQKFDGVPERNSLLKAASNEADAIGATQITRKIQDEDFETAIRFAQELSAQLEEHGNRKELLVCLLSILASRDESERRSAWWKYVSIQSKVAYTRCQQRIGFEKKARKKRYEEQAETFLHLHWYALISSTRIIDPEFPVWETIRLVRERKKMTL